MQKYHELKSAVEEYRTAKEQRKDAVDPEREMDFADAHANLTTQVGRRETEVTQMLSVERKKLAEAEVTQLRNELKRDERLLPRAQLELAEQHYHAAREKLAAAIEAPNAPTVERFEKAHENLEFRVECWAAAVSKMSVDERETREQKARVEQLRTQLEQEKALPAQSGLRRTIEAAAPGVAAPHVERHSAESTRTNATFHFDRSSSESSVSERGRPTAQRRKDAPPRHDTPAAGPSDSGKRRGRSRS